MITPQFSVRQDDDRVYIDIRALHIRSAGGSMEFTVDGELFVFALNPYYLRLRFPGRLLSDEDEQVIEDDSFKSTTSYDASTSIIHISISKSVKGQHFPDLDLVSKLLARTANIVGQNQGQQEIDEDEKKNKVDDLLKKSNQIGTTSGNPPLIQEIDENNNEIQSSSIIDIDNTNKHVTTTGTGAEGEGEGETEKSHTNNNNNISAADIDNHFSKMAAEAEAFDWEIEQHDPGRIEDVNMTMVSDGVKDGAEDNLLGLSDNNNNNNLKGRYGFNRQYSGVMEVSVSSGTNDVNDVIDASTSTPSSRHQLRFELEAMSFDADYYLSDTFDEPPELDSILNWKSEANIAFERLSKKSLSSKKKNDSTSQQQQQQQFALETEESIKFTTKENDYMTQIAKDKMGPTSKSYHNLSTYESKRLYLGLVSIIFASCYEERVTLGEGTVESGWTVAKLCPLFSGLDDEFVDEGMPGIVSACLRRSLCFPYLRNWKLSALGVFYRDVYEILRLGRRRILRVLLRVKQLFDNSSHGEGGSQYYVYSRIWVDDYIAWIQVAAQDSVIRSLAHELRKINFQESVSSSSSATKTKTTTNSNELSKKGNLDAKDLVNLELYELEDAAREALKEQQEQEELQEQQDQNHS